MGLWVYAPAMDGEFISDDQHYVWANPYLQELSLASLREIWDPTSPLVGLVENYAPVHITAHALERHVFGDDTTGYHVVNVVLHALASVLLVALFLRTGLPRAAALVGGAIFLVHPANVEAVAWISQLKSSAALVLAAGALLAHPRRPGLGLGLFGLALLAKPMAFFALPFAVAFGWVRGKGTGGGPPAAAPTSDAPGGWRWGWLGAWAAVLVAFAAVEVAAFAATAGTAPVVYDDPWVRLRSSVAIGGRYLWMAVSGQGLSAFHEPPPVDSWVDPWFLGSLVAGALLAARVVFAWRRRRPELAWWVWAGAAYGPFCGLIALPHTMADRYLYHALPGLLGAALFVASDAASALGRRLGRGAGGPAPAAVAGLALAVALAGLFAVQAHARARIWRSGALVMADAARNYPDGRAAHLSRALRAARMGDAATAVASLRVVQRRGYNRLDLLLQDPVYAPLRDDPGFRSVLDAMAGHWIAALADDPDPSQLELHLLGVSHHLRGDDAAAIRALERALSLEGPDTELIRRDLEALRRAERRAASGDAP